MNKVLEITALSYVYRGNWMVGRKKAVQNLNLEIFEGESFGFLGHNGAGKTTTIKCILNLIKPSTGSVKIFGKSATEVSAREKIGYVPEQPYFYDYLTVAEILQMYAQLSGLHSHDRDNAITQALAAVNMGDRVGASMRSLSKGLTQRIAIAQAIVAKPKLLILDEPFSGMDPIGRKEFRELFLNLKKQGTTIFICSHILSDVELLCDRVSIMSQGELKGVFDIRDKSKTIDFEQGTLEDLFVSLVKGGAY